MNPAITMPSFRERLESFRRTHALRQIEVPFAETSKTWESILCGEGSRTLVTLPSGIHFGEMWFPIIPELERDTRILAPSFPSVSGMEEMLHGICSLLDAAALERVSLLGMSTSGWIAQSFVRKFPDRVERLILSNTSGPNTLDVPALEKAHDMAIRDVDRLLDLSHGKYYTDQALEPATQAFLQSYLKELRGRTRKEEVLGLYRCALDFARGPRYAAADLDLWRGKVLIIETENDAGYESAARMDLRALYPRARTENLGQAGHIPVFNAPEKLVQVIREFLGSTER